MKKFVALCTISVFALSTQAFAGGHSAAANGNGNASEQASETPGGLANGIAKSGEKAANATKKPGQAKKD